MTDLPPLVDSHCHLTWDSYGADLDRVLRRMEQAGVVQAIVVATDGDVARRARDLAGRHPDRLFATAGVHPNDVPADLDGVLADLEALLAGGGFVAVGETGIDHYRDSVAPDLQRAAFAAQVELARRHDLPVVVHVRDHAGRQGAYDVVEEVLAEQPGARGVMHCYTGDVEHARRFRALGFAISFSGVLTFPNGANVREVAAAVPLEETLVETDAPFLAPVPWRGQRNEPAYVAATAQRLAQIHGVPEARARQVTTANARRLFGLPER